MLKIGIIGAGRMGKAHAANIAEIKETEISAVYDIVPEKSAAFAEKYPAARIMESADALISSENVDLIVITSPTYCHKEALLPALKTGKPIFCEKPLCRDPEDLEELAPLITGYSNLFAIGFVRRYSPGVIVMKQMIDEGRIGKLICGSVRCLFGAYSRQWGDWFADYDKSGGVMLDMLAHHCDLQNFIAGKPVSVYARSFMLDKGSELPRDYVSATAEFENGFISNMECSWLRGGPSDNQMTIYGDQGAITFSDRDGLTFYGIGGKAEKIDVDDGILGPLQQNISGDMYALEMATVVDCVINNKRPQAGADDAIKAMKFCLGMMKSAETGEVVRF